MSDKVAHDARRVAERRKGGFAGTTEGRYKVEK